MATSQREGFITGTCFILLVLLVSIVLLFVQTNQQAVLATEHWYICMQELYLQAGVLIAARAQLQASAQAPYRVVLPDWVGMQSYIVPTREGNTLQIFKQELSIGQYRL